MSEMVQAINNEIQVLGTQEFMGIKLPIIEGGFGKGKKALTDLHIGKVHNMKTYHIRELINRNRKRFKDGIDLIDLKGIVQNDNNFRLLKLLDYTKMQISKAQNIYLLSERGYAKLIKIMDTDEAWDIYENLLDDYFSMRLEVKEKALELAEKDKLRLKLFSNDPNEVVYANQRLIEIEREEATAPLKKTIQVQAPKVAFAQAIEVSSDCISVNSLSKKLKENGIDTGQNRLFAWLRDNGYLIKRKGTDYNMPTQKSADMKLFEIKMTPRFVNGEETKLDRTPVVTAKGQQYFINKLKAANQLALC